ncbi:MAG: hypothetical protein GY894_11760 [Planctomycetes bacterium]|nr:hypothetical protein [Planctomycetota bacterium]MCP4840014.1 hypothetical protein [Planctomycetota bacterium]
MRIIKCGGSILGSSREVEAVADWVAGLAKEPGTLIVVVSAPAGVTDLLFASISLNASTTGEQIAEHVSSGERHMAETLTDHLQSRGLPARSLSVREIGLQAAGNPLDADPVSVDVELIAKAAAESPALVIPGFTGMSSAGDIRLLGRGGSDLTAIFLAAELGASCHLVQAAPGIYEIDPVRAEGPRFEQMHWDDLIEMEREVVQAKAVRLAKQRKQPFIVSGLSSPGRTLVGDVAARLVRDDTSHAPS